jgi:hypothetical protein
LATRSGMSPVTGKVAQFSLPTQAVSMSGNSGNQSAGSGCSWWGFGKTDIADVTGDVSGGLPLAPSDVGTSSPFKVASGYVAKNSGGGCGALSYDNIADTGVGRPSGDPLGYEMGAAPYVRVPDVTGTGPSIAGSGYVMSTSLLTTPQQTRSGASTSMAGALVMFPNNPEATTNVAIGSKGLVAAVLDQGSVDCVSGTSAVDGTIAARYTLRLYWWGQGLLDAAPRWHSAKWTYDSSTGSAPVLASGSDTWDPANTVLGNNTKLSDLVQASGTAPNAVSTGANNGLRGFPTGVFTLTTAPTLTNETSPGYSAINAQLGQMTCVADDQR